MSCSPFDLLEQIGSGRIAGAQSHPVRPPPRRHMAAFPVGVFAICSAMLDRIAR
jgi:hypothetical protein